LARQVAAKPPCSGCFNRINERYGNVTTKATMIILYKNIYDAMSRSRIAPHGGNGLPAPNPMPFRSKRECVLWRQGQQSLGPNERRERDEMLVALREVDLWDTVKTISRGEPPH